MPPTRQRAGVWTLWRRVPTSRSGRHIRRATCVTSAAPLFSNAPRAGAGAPRAAAGRAAALGVGDGRGGRDVRGVRQCLGEVAEERAVGRELLGKKAHVVCERNQLLEQRSGLVQPVAVRERAREPEWARREESLLAG